MTRRADADYDKHVFINCPFDEQYLPIFHALVFAVFECGLQPRCALQISDAGETRFEKIVRVVRECRWGTHDISRTQLNEAGLPRFNMPLELGLFLGAKRFGDRQQRRKSCLALDNERVRFQAFIGDIAGQDIVAHHGGIELAIRSVRDWLATEKAGIGNPPSATIIAERFGHFRQDLGQFCRSINHRAEDLTFVEYAGYASDWLRTALRTAIPGRLRL